MQKNNKMKQRAMTIRKTYVSLLLIAITLSCALPAMACEACKKQQPKFLQGITHGAGPGSNWDYLIVGIMTVITLYALYATVKCMIRPQAGDNQHMNIKNMILNQ
jgi:hypothetical protein